MQLSRQPKELERCGWCHLIELFKLYNRFFEKNLKKFFEKFYKSEGLGWRSWDSAEILKKF